MKKSVIAQTLNGKLRGVLIDGVYRFLGVRYAEPPLGENRFQPPVPLKSWTGVKDALVTSVQCWQTDAPQMEVSNVRSSRVFVSQQKMMVGSSKMGVGPMTEDCLTLNLWTSGLSDGGKRPVMVWLHGGGNFCGAADAEWHDGYNMARKNNVVIVNIGHRLNVFGYLYLAAYGDPKYQNSVNMGHQDMVMALQWVHDNIEYFGGDPDNVTIFGQSGGANMVTGLMAMPSARGLFHKVIIQSGGYRIGTKEAGIRNADAFLQYLGIDKDHLDRLHQIPAEDLLNAMRTINQSRRENFLMFPTVNDGSIISGGPFDGAEGTALNSDVPVIIGYTKDDDRLRALFNPALYEITFDELPTQFQKQGFSAEQSLRLIDTYRQILVGEPSAVDIYTAWLNDEMKLRQSEDWYQVRKSCGCAPMYAYVFCFEGPDDELRAIHGVDVPFFFDNAIYAPGIWTVDSRVDAMRLSEICGATWAAFARTGNPNHSGIPTWKPFEEPTRFTMMFDTECKVVSDYRAEARKVIYEADHRLY